jgi:hypothetical protein
MAKRAAVLIKLLVGSVVPTAFFLMEFSVIVSLVLGNTGYTHVVQSGDYLEFVGSGGSLGSFSLSILIISFLCCIVFFVSAVLLFRDWRSERKKTEFLSTLNALPTPVGIMS